MEDGLTIDFTGVKATSFEALDAGWYLCEVTDAQDVETKNAGKLPVGTPGTNWEFTVEKGPSENRRLFTNHWHHPSTLGFMMTLLVESGAYGKEELQEQSGLDVEEARDKTIGNHVWVKVKKRNTEKYGEQNDVQGFRSTQNPPKDGSGGAKKSDSLMP